MPSLSLLAARFCFMLKDMADSFIKLRQFSTVNPRKARSSSPLRSWLWASLLGGLCLWIFRAETQRRAAAELKAVQGQVIYTYDYSQSGGWFPSSILRRWLSRDYFFDDVRSVWLSTFRAADADLIPLTRLRSLEELTLRSNKVTDAGLACLHDLPQLEELSLHVGGVTDDGLVHLHGLTNLRRLTLYAPQVTDAGLVHLRGLPSLTSLRLRATSISGAGLRHLAGLPDLRELDLSYNPITDVGLVQVYGLTGVTTLKLEWTQVTETGLAQLQQALPNCQIDLLENRPQQEERAT